MHTEHIHYLRPWNVSIKYLFYIYLYNLNFIQDKKVQ